MGVVPPSMEEKRLTEWFETMNMMRVMCCGLMGNFGSTCYTVLSVTILRHLMLVSDLICYPSWVDIQIVMTCCFGYVESKAYQIIWNTEY